MEFQIVAFSNISSNLTYFINAANTAKYEINATNGMVTFDPITANETLVVGVRDEYGNFAIKQLHIIYCYCANGGECDHAKYEYQIGKLSIAFTKP